MSKPERKKTFLKDGGSLQKEKECGNKVLGEHV